MHRLFKIDAKSISVGIVTFCVLYLVITQAVNLIIDIGDVSIPKGGFGGSLMGFLALFPFLASGYLTSMRTHPSGVFNSALLGVVVGILVVLYARMTFGEYPPTYSTPRGIMGGVASSLVLCALGGTLGAITRHYR
jgi:hypothetical protein